MGPKSDQKVFGCTYNIRAAISPVYLAGSTGRDNEHLRPLKNCMETYDCWGFHHVFWNGISHWIGNSFIPLDWLAKESQESPCLCANSCVCIIGICHYAPFFTWLLRMDQNPGLGVCALSILPTELPPSSTMFSLSLSLSKVRYF